MQKKVNRESIGPAIELLHRRWSVPVIARLHRHGPLRFSDLARQLPRASRDTLAETLSDLQRTSVIEQTKPDPAYRLTERARALGEVASAAADAVNSDVLAQVALKKWPMLVLVAVGRGANRFNDVKAVLPGVTSGALAPTLKDLEAVGLIERSVANGYPPTVLYVLTSEGERLYHPMDALVRAAATT